MHDDDDDDDDNDSARIRIWRAVVATVMDGGVSYRFVSTFDDDDNDRKKEEENEGVWLQATFIRSISLARDSFAAAVVAHYTRIRIIYLPIRRQDDLTPILSDPIPVDLGALNCTSYKKKKKKKNVAYIQYISMRTNNATTKQEKRLLTAEVASASAAALPTGRIHYSTLELLCCNANEYRTYFYLFSYSSLQHRPPFFYTST